MLAQITPGHDPNDYAIGKRRGLPIINIMNKDGSMNATAGVYAGLDREECRKKLWVRNARCLHDPHARIAEHHAASVRRRRT